MIPRRFEPILFGLILSGLMTCAVSGIATVRAVGWIDGIFGMWMGAWVISWAIAFPLVLFLAPLTRRIVARLVRD